MEHNDTNEIQRWFLHHPTDRRECFVCATRDVTRLFCIRLKATRKWSQVNGTSNFKRTSFPFAGDQTLATTEHCVSSPRLDGFI